MCPFLNQLCTQSFQKCDPWNGRRCSIHRSVPGWREAGGWCLGGLWAVFQGTELGTPFLVWIAMSSHFQDRSVSEIETSFSEHFVQLENQSEDSLDEFPSSEFHFLDQFDSFQAAPLSQLAKFEDNPTRSSSNCSTITPSATPSYNNKISNQETTPQYDPVDISNIITGSETPVKTDMQQPYLDRGKSGDNNTGMGKSIKALHCYYHHSVSLSSFFISFFSVFCF